MKLLAFDLDGTIVTRARVIPTAILETIGRARAAGHAVTVLTGRSEPSARPYVEQLRLEVPYATSQGARVSSPDGGTLHAALLDGAGDLLHAGVARILRQDGAALHEAVDDCGEAAGERRVERGRE